MLLVLLLAGSLLACGKDKGDDDGVASLGTDDTTADGSDDGGDDGEVTDAEREDAFLAFTECMRDHGVDMPDPETGGKVSGPIVRHAEGPNADAENDAFEEANDACEHLIEDVVGDPPERDPEEEAKMQDNALAYAKCMREHGIDFPDPDFSDGGVAMQLGGDVDPEDPDFAEADEACQPLLGFKDGEGPQLHTGGGSGGPDSGSAGVTDSAEKSAS